MQSDNDQKLIRNSNVAEFCSYTNVLVIDHACLVDEHEKRSRTPLFTGSGLCVRKFTGPRRHGSLSALPISTLNELTRNLREVNQQKNFKKKLCC